MSAKDVEAEGLRLPPKQRRRLAERLLGSLEGEPEADAEDLWLDEAERRYQAYQEGKVEGRSADEAVRRARSRLP